MARGKQSSVGKRSHTAVLPPATLRKRRRRMESIIKGLAEAYPEAECELSVATPIQLLVATILSAQATDKMVNTVTPSLFKRYPDVEAFATAGVSELEELIRTIGLFRAKARNIIKASQAIVQDHGGVVPDDLDALVTLAGVGRKTANCVLVNAFGKPGIMCDTHCCRLSQRIGLTEQTHPDKIEAALAQLMPPEQWGLFSHRIIWHGRRVCHARKPNCGDCNLLPFCDYGQNV